LDEGHRFDFRNFCYPNQAYPERYGGEDAPEWMAWKARVLRAVKRLSAEDSPASLLAARAVAINTRGNYLAEFERAKASLLQSLEMVNAALKSDAYGELRSPESTNASPLLSNRVFVVHGHDSGLKTDVERFLREIGLEPVVLHRQPDQGGTVIEKFERHSDVGYAFILLTPDEVAYTVDQQGVSETERITELRARPNVIFEFGYFVGRLGRERVCCLSKGEVTMPSDLGGLVYKNVGDSLDSQAYSIILELKAAGYDLRV